jgi:hypothetical protein
VALEPKLFLLAVTSVYSVSGPLAYLVGMVRRRGTASASVREAEETRATP